MIRIDLSKKTTTEIVVLLFTVLICSVMVITITGVIVAKTIHPEMDVSKGSDAINSMLSTIIGALVGFISGRAYGRKEQEQVDKNGST